MKKKTIITITSSAVLALAIGAAGTAFAVKKEDMQQALMHSILKTVPAGCCKYPVGSTYKDGTLRPKFNNICGQQMPNLFDDVPHCTKPFPLKPKPVPPPTY